MWSSGCGRNDGEPGRGSQEVEASLAPQLFTSCCVTAPRPLPYSSVSWKTIFPQVGRRPGGQGVAQLCGPVPDRLWSSTVSRPRAWGLQCWDTPAGRTLIRQDSWPGPPVWPPTVGPLTLGFPILTKQFICVFGYTATTSEAVSASAVSH